MDDLMNKVGALIEEHVKNEVEARALIHSIQIKECQARECSCPSKDEIRRGVRALGFWEKLVETLCVGPADEATFDNVMAKIQTLRVERDEAKRTEMSFTAQFNLMRTERDKYRAMWEQLHRAQSEDLDAKEQLKELLSTLGLAHFDSATVSEAVRRTHEYDRKQRETIRRLDEEVAASLREHQKTLAKVRELDAKLLEVRKAVGERARPKVDDEVRCGHWHGVVIGFRVEDGAVMVRRTYNGESELRYLKAEELEVIAP